MPQAKSTTGSKQTRRHDSTKSNASLAEQRQAATVYGALHQASKHASKHTVLTTSKQPAGRVATAECSPATVQNSIKQRHQCQPSTTGETAETTTGRQHAKRPTPPGRDARTRVPGANKTSPAATVCAGGKTIAVTAPQSFVRGRPVDARGAISLTHPCQDEERTRKSVRSVEQASPIGALNMRCSSPRASTPKNSGRAKQNDCESKTSSTLGTLTPPPSPGAASRKNGRPSTPRQHFTSPVRQPSPEQVFVAALPRNGMPTDKDAVGSIYAFTSPMSAQVRGCVKIGRSEGDRDHAISRIRQQERHWGPCQPMIVLATKYHKLAELLTHRALNWPDGSTVELQGLSCLKARCTTGHQEWFTWRRSAAQRQAKEIESEVQQSKAVGALATTTSRAASATGGDRKPVQEELFSRLWHNRAYPAMRWAVHAADSCKDVSSTSGSDDGQ